MDKLMTCVFPMDVEDVEANPLQVITPFGKPVCVSRGDLAEENERLRADVSSIVKSAQAALEDADFDRPRRCLERIVANHASAIQDEGKDNG